MERNSRGGVRIRPLSRRQRPERVVVVVVAAVTALLALGLAGVFVAWLADYIERKNPTPAVDDTTWRAVAAYKDPIGRYLSEANGHPFDGAVDGLVGGGLTLKELRAAGEGVHYGDPEPSESADETRVATIIAVGGEHPTRTCFTIVLGREPVTLALDGSAFEERDCTPAEARAAGAGSHEVSIVEFSG